MVSSSTALRFGCVLVLLAIAAACGFASTDPQAPRPEVETFAEPPEGWDPWIPSISPDGARVAWFGYDETHRPRVGLIGPTSLEVLTPRSMRAADLAWLPDSEGLVVAFHEDHRTKFAVVDLDGEVLDRVEPADRIVADSSGMVALDEDTIVIAARTTWATMSPADLYRLDLKNGVVENLTRTPKLDERWPVPLTGSRWLISGGLITSQEGGPTGWAGIFDARTGDLTRLTDSSHFVDRAVLVPGTSRVVFDSAFQVDRGIWETDLSGSEPEQLLGIAGVRWPAPAPDGRYLLLKVVGTPSEPGGFVKLDLSEEGEGSEADSR